MKKENKVSFIFGITGLIGLAYFLYSAIPFKQFNFLMVSKRFWFFIAYLLLIILFLVWEILKGKENDWQEDIFSFLTRIPKNIRKTITTAVACLKFFCSRKLTNGLKTNWIMYATRNGITISHILTRTMLIQKAEFRLAVVPLQSRQVKRIIR